MNEELEFGEDKDSEIYRRLKNINTNFSSLAKLKDKKYSTKNFEIKCISKKNACLNFTIPELLEKYPGIIESLYLKHLMMMDKIDIDHRITMITFLSDLKEKALSIYKDSYVFYELVPIVKTKSDREDNKLFYYHMPTQKTFQTFVNPKNREIKFYHFIELLAEPEGILINYIKNNQ